jgi:DNA-directed RNA polymerase subunit L
MQKKSKSAKAKATFAVSDEPTITELKVSTIIYGDLVEKREDLKAMMPEFPTEKLSFIIRNAGAPIANAIRRAVITEVKAKALTFEVSEVVTNDREIILAELLDRISFLVVDQKIPLDTVFSLNKINTSTKKETMQIYARDLVQISGEKLATRPFSSTWRIVSLRPEKHITIPQIRIVEGYGYQHACFSITSEFKFQVRDFVDISQLNNRGNVIKGMVRRSELFSAMKANKVTIPAEFAKTDDLCKPKILIISNPDFLKMVNQKDLPKIKAFPTIIETKEVPIYSSLTVDPQEYFLEFITYGNIRPIELMKMTCDCLIERLEDVSKEENLIIQHDDKKTRILIKGEDHTIGNLLKYTIFKLAPGIGLVNSTLEHPQIRVVTINIIHPEPVKIFRDAAMLLIAQFQNLKKQFAAHE